MRLRLARTFLVSIVIAQCYSTDKDDGLAINEAPRPSSAEDIGLHQENGQHVPALQTKNQVPEIGTLENLNGELGNNKGL